MMVTIVELIQKLRSPENKRVLQAVEELRVRGWLEDGSLRGVPLCHAHMQGSDLLSADMSRADLHQADLSNSDLSNANLSDTKLTRVNFQGSNLSKANLVNADMYKVNLRDAHNLTDEQLSKAKRLFGAIMPDGETYDGRYNLPGDLEFARWGRIDIHDPEKMAEFFGVSVETYQQGQHIPLEKTSI